MNAKIIFTVFLIICTPLSVLADNKGINKMAKDLNLNSEQKIRVEAIINTEKQTVEAIFKEEENKLKATQQQTHDSLQQVLTPEQMAKLEKKAQQQTNQHRGKKH